MHLKSLYPSGTGTHPPEFTRKKSGTDERAEGSGEGTREPTASASPGQCQDRGRSSLKAGPCWWGHLWLPTSPPRWCGSDSLLKHNLQLKYDQCIINARSNSGAILFTLLQSGDSQERREKEKEGQVNGGKKKKIEGGRQKKWEIKEIGLLFFFFWCVCLHDFEVLANSICPQQSHRRREKAFPYVQISIQAPLICAVVLWSRWQACLPNPLMASE